MTKKDDGNKSAADHEGRDNALAARRARLRSTLAKQSSESSKSEVVNIENRSSGKQSKQDEISTAGHKQEWADNMVKEQVAAQLDTVAVLNHIDQVLNACVTHLVSLQNVGDKQIEELKAIAQTLQSRDVYESTQTLNPLMESLTAAIEPMKAIGELVPALDRLVNASEEKAQSLNKTQISDEKLVIDLAQQLAAGVINPLTFKSAYQAIFANEDSTMLIHKLGQLLDSQQLSGELFQVTFQALNTPNSFDDSENDNDKELHEEFSKQLAAKEKEIDNIRLNLDSQWQELAAECEELKTALEAREDIVKERELELNKKVNELAAKDSENQQLKAQIEELKDKTKEMMTDLQMQLARKQEEGKRKEEELARKQEEEQAAKTTQPSLQSPQSGFFDFVSAPSSNDNLFSGASPSLLAEEGQSKNVSPETPFNGSDWQRDDTTKTNSGFPASNIPAPVSDNISVKQSLPGMIPPGMLPSDPQPITQGAAVFASAVGSYGSGVRAQVFEVIVRQALAGTQWREICAVPMQSNNISPQEVEAEVKRRQALLSS